MMDKAYTYIDTITEILQKIKDTQTENIEKATRLLYSAFKEGNSIFVFGASHAGIIAEEMFCRAGGLMVVNPIFNPTLMLNTRPFTVTSHMERLEGFGNIIMDNSAVKKGDVIIIHSVSGRNSVAIDMAIRARDMGVSVVVITNMDYTRKVPSRHSSGKMLYELGDVVIDNCGCYGDASVPVGGVKAGPTSSVSGTAIVNMMAVGFAQMCVEDGIDPPVFVSANADKGDSSSEESILHRYRERIHYL